MSSATSGKVVSVQKQGWFKINRKLARFGSDDGAAYPHIAKVSYTVDGKAYTKNKWIWPGTPLPSVGAEVQVAYDADKPQKARIL